MIVKIIAIAILLFIMYSLGSALVYLLKDKSDSDRLVKALSWRIGLSILLFVFLMLAVFMGWIQPSPYAPH